MLFILIISQAYSKEKNPLTLNIENLTDYDNENTLYPKLLNVSNYSPLKGIGVISFHKQDSINQEQPPAIKPDNHKKVIPEGDADEEEWWKMYRTMEKHKGWDFMYDYET